MRVGLKAEKMCTYFYWLASFGGSIDTKDNHFCFCRFPPLPMTNSKVLVCEMFNTFLPLHGPCLYDVTDADCWAQSGSTRSCVFVTFKHQFLTNQMRSVKKNRWVSIFYSVPVNRAPDDSWLWFPLK